MTPVSNPKRVWIFTKSFRCYWMRTPKPPSPSDPHWKSQQIYIPVKQEKWNEASVMRMHQSMMAIPSRRQSYESPYMKELEFDDDDKSLDITDVFPVLLKNGDVAQKKARVNKPSSASGPAILQAAKQANANKRWRTAGQKIAATRQTPATPAAPSTTQEPNAPPPPPPPVAAPKIPHDKQPTRAVCCCRSRGTHVSRYRTGITKLQ